VCCNTGYGIAYLVKKKPNAEDFITFLEYCRSYARKYGWIINKVRADAGTTEGSVAVQLYLGQHKILLETAAPEQQNQNPVERYIQTIKKDVAAMMIAQFAVGRLYWGPCLLMAVSGRNLVPNTMGYTNETPILAVAGQLTNLSKSAKFYFGEQVIMKKTERPGIAEPKNEFGVVIGRVNMTMGSYLCIRYDKPNNRPVERFNLFPVAETSNKASSRTDRCNSSVQRQRSTRVYGHETIRKDQEHQTYAAKDQLYY
jgi:hypothetical protein